MTTRVSNPLPARLDHIGLIFAEPAAAAERLSRILGLPILERRAPWAAGSPALRIGEVWLEFLSPDHPTATQPAREGLHHLGLAVEDPAAQLTACQAGGIALEDAGAASRMTGGATGFLNPAQTAGIRLRFVPDVAGETDSPASSAGLERIDHIGVASADNAVARSVFSGQLGFPVESSQLDSEGRITLESFASDKYGVVYHTRPPEWLGGLHVLFITVGDCELELLQDLSESAAGAGGSAYAGSTKRDQSAIARFVQARGPGLHHIAVKVADMDRALAHAAANGAVLLDERGRPGSRRAQIAFLHPKSASGVLVHFVQREVLD